MWARTTSTRSATNITATRPCCSKPSRATASTSVARTAPATGQTGYDFPARQEGRVILEEFPSRATRRHAGLRAQPAAGQVQGSAGAPGLQPRLCLRGASTRRIFSGQYERIGELFPRPRARLLGPARGTGAGDPRKRSRQDPARCLHQPLQEPRRATTPEAVRTNLREADRLLREAGWELKNGRRVNATGRNPDRGAPRRRAQRRALFPPLQERHSTASASPPTCASSTRFNTSIASARSISTSSPAYGAQSLSPGNEQREFWGSQAATREGSRNLAGIADPGVDALIDRVIFAKDRDELVAATKALDRVLLAHDYVVPQWGYGKQRTARWNRYSHPETMPRYGASAFPDHMVVRRGQGGQDRSATMRDVEPQNHSPKRSRRGGALGSPPTGLCSGQ